MSMNIDKSRTAPGKIQRFSPQVVAALFLAPLVVAFNIGIFFGLAWGIAFLGLVIWSDVLLRFAGVNFRGRRKKDKVMAPCVDKFFACHAPDETLGWTLRPDFISTNTFSIPRKHLHHEYTVTTDAGHRRITATAAHPDKPVIAVYGCSNTFGWGLNDDETYAWQLQNAFPDHRVLNYGVSGYSLYQILLRMEQTLEQDNPTLVILGFSPGLEARSVSDHHYLRILSEQGGTPPSCLATDNEDGSRSLQRFPLEAYKHLPLASASPLIKLIEQFANRLMYAPRAKNDAHRKTTEYLLMAMAELCKRHGATFHVQYLVANTGYRRFLSDNAINWAPGPVDLDQCEPNGNYVYRLSPFDGHPNVRANQAYAEAMRPIITELLNTGVYDPGPNAFGTGKRDEATESAIYPIF